jgi:hypothetical protein
MQFTKKQKVAAVLGAGAVAVAGSGIAFAYWSTTGSGNSTASTAPGNAAAVTIATSSATPIGAMFPGDSAQPLKATVSNGDASQKVYVSHVFAYLTVSKAQNAVGSCDSSDYLLDGVAGTTALAVTDPNTHVTTGGPVTLNWTAQELNAKGTAAQPATGSFSDTNGTGDSIQFNDKAASNQDGCKGATVTINYVSN